jgi:hypothetical protein
VLDKFDIEALLSLDGASFEAAEGYVVEFKAQRTEATEERPHGLTYALVFRPLDGEPYVRFDNAHAVERPGGKYVKAARAYDHWHRTERDPGRPYAFTTAAQLLEDFRKEVKRGATNSNQRSRSRDVMAGLVPAIHAGMESAAQQIGRGPGPVLGR